MINSNLHALSKEGNKLYPIAFFNHINFTTDTVKAFAWRQWPAFIFHLHASAIRV